MNCYKNGDTWHELNGKGRIFKDEDVRIIMQEKKEVVKKLEPVTAWAVVDKFGINDKNIYFSSRDAKDAAEELNSFKDDIYKVVKVLIKPMFNKKMSYKKLIEEFAEKYADEEVLKAEINGDSELPITIEINAYQDFNDLMQSKEAIELVKTIAREAVENSLYTTGSLPKFNEDWFNKFMVEE